MQIHIIFHIREVTVSVFACVWYKAEKRMSMVCFALMQGKKMKEKKILSLKSPETSSRFFCLAPSLLSLFL